MYSRITEERLGELALMHIHSEMDINIYDLYVKKENVSIVHFVSVNVV